jgi:Nucleotidyl transferase AbiEii toxin, Type IV TA system
MIGPGTYTKSWITNLSTQLGKRGDPKLLEKVIYALTLLEQLKIAGLDFIFKGGTSLLLISPTPRRFSIDIDIVADYKLKDIPPYLDRVVTMGNFKRWVDDNDRKGQTAAPVAHYKFYYTSQFDNYYGEEPILLDLLIGDNPYPEVTDADILHPWLQSIGSAVTVSTPRIDCILGDKLTAFAPKTTGILYEKKRPVEMIKQLYDIGSLFNDVQDFKLVKASYIKNAEQEIIYRNLAISWTDALDDTYQAARILSRKESDNEEYQHLQKGITNIVNFILGKFHIEEAIVCASKTAYMTKMLKLEVPSVKLYTGKEEMGAWTIESDTKLNKLKKTNPEAFFYWYQILQVEK